MTLFYIALALLALGAIYLLTNSEIEEEIVKEELERRRKKD